MPDPQAPITDPKELEQFLHAPMENLPAGTGGAARDLLPLTAQELKLYGPTATEKLVQEEQRPGIPIQVNPPEDLFQGVGGNFDPWIRFQTARRQSVTDQQKYLESLFPGKVRKAKNSDDFLIEVNDPDTGKPKDVLLNEEQITLGDLAAVAGKSPELAASVIGMMVAGPTGAALGRGPGLLKALGAVLKSTPGQLAAGAAGYKAGQAGEQIATRLEQGQAPEVGATLTEKAKEIPGQAGADLATYGLFKAANFARRATQGGPGLWKRPEQIAGLPAEERLRGEFGKGIRYSGAESSGMPLLAFLEAYASAKPQSTPVTQMFKDAQLGDIKALSEAITAGAGSDEEAGNKLLAFLSSNQKVKQDALDKVRSSMTEKESAALTKQIGKVAPWAGPIEPSATGAGFRSDFQNLYQGVKTKVRDAYATAKGVPGAATPDVPTKPITDEIDFLLQQHPNVEGVQWLNQYKKTFPDKESYFDIVDRRSDLWKKIEESPADRSTKDYLHGQLSRAMTDTLDDAAKNILNPQFKSLIENANKLYKTQELPFYQQGLYDVLRKAGDRGSPENIELLDRFRGSTDLYRRLVDVAGKGSKPVQAINTAVIDGLMSKSGTTAFDPKYIDGKQLYENLTELASNKNTREMFKDIFGTQAKPILEQAKVLSGIQGSIPKEEAEAMLTGKASAASKQRLKAVMDAQRQLDTVEAKRLLNAPVDEINPEKMINSYTDKLTESEVKTLADRMKNDAPPLYEQMREKQIEQILGKAGNYRTWSQSKIEKVLYDPKWEPKYRALLGDRFQNVEDFAKALGPIEQAEKTAEGTGMLVKGESIGALASIFKLKPGGKRGGSTVGRILTRGMEEIPGWMGWKIAAKGIYSGAFRDWASKDFPAESAKLLPAALISEPILMDMASSASSPEVLRDAAMRIRDWSKRVSQPEPQQQEQPAIQDRKGLEQFLKE